MCPHNILSADNQNKQQSVLIIEKDENLRKGIAVALMSHFSEIIMIEDFDEAFTYIQNKKFSVVIAGITHLSGQFSNDLKSIAGNNPTTKFIISLPDVSESLGSQFEEHVNVLLYEKPIDLHSIINQIKT